MKIRILKFGGTSMGSGERICAASELVKSELSEGRPVVVASAMSGVTDLIVRTTQALLVVTSAEDRICSIEWFAGYGKERKQSDGI